jgi:hypothetical protein
MIINKGGNLSEEYFLSYMKLIMNSFQCSLDEAEKRTFKLLFNNQENTLGSISYSNFINAMNV